MNRGWTAVAEKVIPHFSFHVEQEDDAGLSHDV